MATLDVADPLFQTNLFIFLTWPRTTTDIDPVLYRSGFRLEALGREVFIPSPTLSVVQTAGRQVQASAKPEMILSHGVRQMWLLLECKASSFSPQSTTASQAITYLLMCEPYVSGALSKTVVPGWSVKLAYAVVNGPDLLEVTLQELTNDLSALGQSVNPSEVWGLEQRNDGVYVVGASGSEFPDPIRVLETEDGSDSRPLYLIPFDKTVNGKDEFGIQVLTERIRSVAVSILGPIGPFPISFSTDDFARQVTPVWDVWHDPVCRSDLKKRIKLYVKGLLDQLSRFGVEYSMSGENFNISTVAPQDATRVRDYLASSKVKTSRQAYQVTMSDLEEPSSIVEE